LPAQPAIGSLVAGNRLLMIGDSITASAAKRYGGEFCKALVPLGWQVEVDAEPSRFVDFGNTVLDKRLSAKWDAAYVFLGSNYLGDQESYRKQLEKIVQRLSPTPVVLLTVTEFEDNRREVNDAITLVSAEFPNVHLLDWGSIAAANADTILRGDGLHLTNDGRAVLASTIAGVMGQAPLPQGDCLGTSFSNDSGLSVNGSDTPSKKKVGGSPTPTTVKSPTVTTTGGGGTATTKPPVTVAPTVAPTVPPSTAAPTTQPPAPEPTTPRRTVPDTTPTP
jgi:cell division septation protein DedD